MCIFCYQLPFKKLPPQCLHLRSLEVRHETSKRKAFFQAFHSETYNSMYMMIGAKSGKKYIYLFFVNCKSFRISILVQEDSHARVLGVTDLVVYDFVLSS